MTTPEIALERLAAAVLLGVLLGIWYDVLTPPRARFPKLSDGMFVLGLGWGMLILGFQVCRGDLRLGYVAGFLPGILAWKWTLGRLFAPVFAWIWRILGKMWRLFLLPVKKISIFAKFLFASGEKWVTIKCNNRHKIRRASGGQHYGRKDKSLPQCAGEVPPQQTPDQDHCHCYHRTVYHCHDHPALGSE